MKKENDGALYGHPGDRRYDRRQNVITLSASVEDTSDKPIVSTRLLYHYRLPDEKPSQTGPFIWRFYDTYWRIPPHREVHLRWNQDTRLGRPEIASQFMTCALFAVTFEDGSTWAAQPGNVAGGNADRHRGPL